MSDVYEFAKSNLVQGSEDECPYVSKQWQYVNDINSGVYSNNGISLVQFDLSNIFNSSCFVDVSQAYFVVPVVYIQASASTLTGAMVSPAANNTGDMFRLGLKCGYFNLVHACEIMVNGQTMESYQPYLNAYVGFKLMSDMSIDDLNNMGPSLGMGNKLDNPESVRFNNYNSSLGTGVYGSTTTVINGPAGGNGIYNNQPFGTANPNFGDQTAFGIQNTGSYNNGLFSRMNRISDIGITTIGAGNMNLYGTVAGGSILSATNLANEFKPTFQVLNTSYCVWYDYAVIRLGDLLDSMNKMPLTKKFDGIVRLSLNTGVVGTQTLTANATGCMLTSGSSNSFVGTCPLMVPSLLTAPLGGGIATTSGLFIARPIGTTQWGINLALSGASSPMQACRFYYPQVVLRPINEARYLSENRNKTLNYTSILYNQGSTITAGGAYSALIQSGVSNIKGILILPFISQSTHGLLTGGANPVTGITTFSELISPFDCAPMQTPPISLINLSVSVGGQNVMQNFVSYTFENFIEQVSLYDKINGAQFGLTCGLISQYAWENSYRSYYVDCSRGLPADNLTPRNVNITFTNNTQQTIDCLFFIEYTQTKIIDVQTGLFKNSY